MKNNIKLPLVIIPAFVVTATSLFILLVTVATAASNPGDLFYALRGPAMQVPFVWSNDGASAGNRVTAPAPSNAGVGAPVIKKVNPQTIEIQIPAIRNKVTESNVSKQPEDSSSKAIGTGNEKETETGTVKGTGTEKESGIEKDSEKDSGTSHDDSGNHSSNSSDDSKSSDKEGD